MLFVCVRGVIDVMILFFIVLCWIYRVWSSTECAYCACDPSVHLSVLSICFFVLLYVGSYLLI